MSFGISAGDFIAVAKLIKSVVSALHGQAAFEYRELVNELHGLQRALSEIEHLPTTVDNEAAINAVKAAALMCHYPLEDFAGKLKKYSMLAPQGGGTKRDVLIGIGKKAQWNIAMPSEVAKLRAYLAAHVGSLNMRILTLGITSTALAANRAKQRDSSLGVALESLDGSIQRNNTMVQQTHSGIELLRDILSNTVVPQLQALVGLAQKVWASNMQMMAMLSHMHDTLPPVDFKHTWFQEPIRFEDALGRLLPVPAEYSWSKLEAIILDQFRTGPGHDKVFAGEYELFDSNDPTLVLTSDTPLRPALSVTMSIVVGRYDHSPHESCPKPGCRSRQFSRHKAAIKVCQECGTYFGPSSKQLPRPYRRPQIESFEVIGRKRKREPDDERRREVWNGLDMMRNDRKYFKNMRIHRRRPEEWTLHTIQERDAAPMHACNPFSPREIPPKPRTVYELSQSSAFFEGSSEALLSKDQIYMLCHQMKAFAALQKNMPIPLVVQHRIFPPGQLQFIRAPGATESSSHVSSSQSDGHEQGQSLRDPMAKEMRITDNESDSDKGSRQRQLPCDQFGLRNILRHVLRLDPDHRFTDDDDLDILGVDSNLRPLIIKQLAEKNRVALSDDFLAKYRKISTIEFVLNSLVPARCYPIRYNGDELQQQCDRVAMIDHVGYDESIERDFGDENMAPATQEKFVEVLSGQPTETHQNYYPHTRSSSPVSSAWWSYHDPLNRAERHHPPSTYFG